MTTQQRPGPAHDGPGRPPAGIHEVIADAVAAHAQTREVGSHVDEMAGLAGNLMGLMHGVAGPLVESAAYTAEGAGQVWEGWDAPSAAPPALWTDLRPSEATRLMALIHEAVDRAVPLAEAAIIEAVIEAGERFAAEYPDAPRPQT